MKKDLLIKMTEGQIGYVFKNHDLLLQAYKRSSYANENGGEDNEILEFIGDKALDLAVVNILISRYGDTNNELICSLDENELTKIKSRMVQKRTLARRIDEMGLAEYLLMGKGDVANNVFDEPSVKEDLFEAIIGAVAVDCGWNFEKICSVVDAMLEPDRFLSDDEDNNYVRMIQEWEEQENGTIPLYRFKESSYESTFYIPFAGKSQVLSSSRDYLRVKYQCELKLLDDLDIYRGFGASKSEARMNVCKLAYEDLKRNGIIRETSIRDEIEEPNKEDAISQLEILARRGYFSIPTYEFRQDHDKNGNPVWTAICRIKDYNKICKSVSSSKKGSKKGAAYKMLQYVLSKEDD